MTARYLTFPNGATGPPSGFSPSITDQRTLYGLLADVNRDVAINPTGEGFPKEYPTPTGVGSFVLEGGVYVDLCGWPMWYVWDGSQWQWYNAGALAYGQAFGDFLTSMSVDANYVDSFDPHVTSIPSIRCPSTPYQRMLVSRYRFPQVSSVIISPSITETCVNIDSENTEYAYAMVAVQAGSGWYFWASGNTSGAHVNATAYAQWIRSVLGYAPNANSGGNNGCPPGYVLSGSKCVLQCPAGQSLVNGQCVTPGHGGNVTLPKTSTNLPLIIGGGLAGIGVIVALTMLGGK